MNHTKELFEILSRLAELNFKINVAGEEDIAKEEIRETLIPEIKHFKGIADDKWLEQANDMEIATAIRAWQFVYDAALALGYTNSFD